MLDHLRRPLFALLALGALGCGAQSEPEAESGGQAAPEAPAEMPAAILGTAPAPQGVDLAYFDENPSAMGYLAIPEGEGPFPGLILIHEWNGLVDRIRQTADALADEGYVALAVDLYAGQVGTSRDENIALMSAANENMDEVIGNLNAASSYLRARPDVTGKIASMGWCFGGGIALSFALGGEHHEGTAIFYGQLIDDPERLAMIDHEVYGTFAELDQGIPPADVERFVEALRAAGVPNDVHVYDAVNHGFWLRVEEDPDVRGQPAADAWARLKAYLDRTLSE